MFIFSWKVKLCNVVLGKRERRKGEAEGIVSAKLWNKLCLYPVIVPLFSASPLVSFQWCIGGVNLGVKYLSSL